jgi:hypothetical protein
MGRKKNGKMGERNKEGVKKRVVAREGVGPDRGKMHFFVI